VGLFFINKLFNNDVNAACSATFQRNDFFQGIKKEILKSDEKNTVFPHF
jgi:hypothetical protein